MEYRLARRINLYRDRIAVVGCGGTGGFAAEGLCRILQGSDIRLILIDGDWVEEQNLRRQNFYPEDLGRFKSQALAERLACKYGCPIAYSISPLSPRLLQDISVVVGCVDNAPARATIAGAVSPPQWWVDAGNGQEFGQLLVGNAAKSRLEGSFDKEGVCHALPLPTLVRPELLVPAFHRPSCAQVVEQGATINQFMAALVVEMVRRLLEERLTWWQVYLDLESGTLRTVAPTPEGVSRLTGIPVRKLTRR